MKKMLILFTLSFPYYKGQENTFLQHEVLNLKNKFDRFIIIPNETVGNKQKIPNKIEINENFAHDFKCRKNKQNKFSELISSITTIIFFKEIIFNHSILFCMKKLSRLINFIRNSLFVKKWFEQYIIENKLRNNKLIIYTYWFNYITTGLVLAVKKYSQIKVVTRAHGIDLYEERNKGYIPLRNQSLKLLDRLYLVSNNGKNYISQKYPFFITISKVYGLGVKNPGFFTKRSVDGKFRVISCGAIIPVKRIHLILSGLIELARNNDKKVIIWTHIGDGVLGDKIKQNAKLKSPMNLECIFRGHLQNEYVLRYYKKNPVDVFINVSESEGGRPVSIQEAQSCGIPVIGTNVGGIPEIVNNKVGKLISSNPSPKEIADALAFFLINPEKALEMRKNSKLNWKNNFNADKNFKAFANDLANLHE